MSRIPNLLTLLRLLLAPVVILAVLDGQHGRALLVFAFAGATDGLDGFLARRFGWMTALGAWLDPIADKALLSGVYLALAAAGLMPWWFVALVFARDILILGGAAAVFFFTQVRKFPPSPWGKLCTFLQIATAVVWMTGSAFPGYGTGPLATALLWLSTAATVWSGLHYGWLGLRLVRGG
jgi:cardiolipin synthase